MLRFSLMLHYSNHQPDNQRLSPAVDRVCVIRPAVERLTFQHGEHHDDHVLLQVEQLPQEVHLAGVSGQLVLHVREQEQEAAHRVPQPGQQRQRQGPAALTASTGIMYSLLAFCTDKATDFAVYEPGS